MAAAVATDNMPSEVVAAEKSIMTELPRPYSFLFHPLSFWLDKFLSWIVSLLLPVRQSARYLPRPEKETLEMKEKVQKNFKNNTGYRIGSVCKKWSSLYGVPLVETILKVPRRHDILVKWGILGNDELPQTKAGDIVHVFVRFPISILSEEKRTELLANSKPSNESGCIRLESLDLADIPVDVPILIWFHGGGLVFGSNNCADGVEAITDIVEKASTFGEARSGIKHPAVVLASSQYRLAPEDPFPAAPIDALSTAAYFLESNPSRKINMAGVSAGAYVATLATMECFRRYPGRVKSLFANSPMLCPATDTMSYYLESNASLHCPVEFLRFGWKSYLELEESENDNTNHTDSEEGAFLLRGSTRRAWDQCKWKKSTARRLVEPALDLPSGLDTNDAPKIVVVTCTADPLHDDGLHLAKALKASDAVVTHVDCFGSHVIGYMLDSPAKAKATLTWSEAVFTTN